MRERGRTLALIPARAGSKGLPGKNLRLLGGKPLIAWTIAAARGASGIDRVVVSTDDEEIATVARRYGAETPFLRPRSLATDEASSLAVVFHALSHLRATGYEPERVALLQPTSPLRTSVDIQEGLELLDDSEAPAVVSVCELEYPPAVIGPMGSGGRLDALVPAARHAPRRQDEAPWIRVNGALYVAPLTTLARHGRFFVGGARGHLMPRERSVDIDLAFDLEIAEAALARERSRVRLPEEVLQ